MKELQGSASTEMELPAEDCFAVARRDRSLPGWFEVVRAVECSSASATASRRWRGSSSTFPRACSAPISSSMIAIEAERPGRCNSRSCPPARAMRIASRSAGGCARTAATEIEFEFDAAVSFVPGYLPVGSAGDVIAEAILGAAANAFGDAHR